jgi:1,2-phenylacetyl-CoA epoxidase catalytic subunit
MYILMTLLIILICIIVIKFLIDDMAIRLTCIKFNCSYNKIKELVKKERKEKK